MFLSHSPTQYAANGYYYRCLVLPAAGQQGPSEGSQSPSPSSSSSLSRSNYLRVVLTDALRYELAPASETFWAIIRARSNKSQEWAGSIIYGADTEEKGVPVVPTSGWKTFKPKVSE